MKKKYGESSFNERINQSQKVLLILVLADTDEFMFLLLISRRYEDSSNISPSQVISTQHGKETTRSHDPEILS